MGARKGGSPSGGQIRRTRKGQVVAVGVTQDDFVDTVFLRLGIFGLHAFGPHGPDEGVDVVEPEA